MKKFTFKQHPRLTGLAGVAYAGKEWVDIKLNNVIVGNLYKGGSLSQVQIRFKIWKKDIMEDGNPNCKWKWVTLKYNPESIIDAKNYIHKFNNIIQAQLNLYIEE